jgi:hypothetical protein
MKSGLAAKIRFLIFKGQESLKKGKKRQKN